MHRIIPALILKRNPILLRTPTQFEQEYALLKQSTTVDKLPYIAQFFEQKRVSKSDQSAGSSSSSGSESARQENEQEQADKLELMEQLDLQRRVSQADRDQDMRSLNREQTRSLYLCIQDPLSLKWHFPHFDQQSKEHPLHVQAEQGLKDKCGDQMSVWMVGRAPVCHLKLDDQNVFFLKAQIMSGQVINASDPEKVKDFCWLTRQELEHKLPPTYYAAVKDSLASL